VNNHNPLQMICKGILRVGQVPAESNLVWPPIELFETDTIEVLFTANTAELQRVIREGVVIWEKPNE